MTSGSQNGSDGRSSVSEWSARSSDSSDDEHFIMNRGFEARLAKTGPVPSRPDDTDDDMSSVSSKSLEFLHGAAEVTELHGKGEKEWKHFRREFFLKTFYEGQHNNECFLYQTADNGLRQFLLNNGQMIASLVGSSFSLSISSACSVVHHVCHVLIPGSATSLARLYHKCQGALAPTPGGNNSNGGNNSAGGTGGGNNSSSGHRKFSGFGGDRGRDFFGRLLRSVTWRLRANGPENKNAPMIVIIGLPVVGKTAVAHQLVALLAESSLSKNDESFTKTVKRTISGPFSALVNAASSSSAAASASASILGSAAATAFAPAPAPASDPADDVTGEDTPPHASSISAVIEKLNSVRRTPRRGIEIYPKCYQNGTGNIVVIHIHELAEGLLPSFRETRTAISNSSSRTTVNGQDDDQQQASSSSAAASPALPSASLSADEKADLLEFARSHACIDYVFPEEKIDNLIIVTDTLYDKRGSEMANVIPAADSGRKYRTAARVADRHLMPIYLECDTEENVRRLESRTFAAAAQAARAAQAAQAAEAAKDAESMSAVNSKKKKAKGRAAKASEVSKTISAISAADVSLNEAELEAASQAMREFTSKASFYMFRDPNDPTRRRICGRQIATTDLTPRETAEEIIGHLNDVENGVADDTSLGPIAFSPSDPLIVDEPVTPDDVSVDEAGHDEAGHNDGDDGGCDSDHEGRGEDWTVLTKTNI